MKVLFQSRKTLFTVPGGDTIQIIKTKEYLEQLGISVDISLELEPDVSRYDLVHLFNLVRPQEVYLQVLNATRQGKKTALSTIYVSTAEYDKKAREGFAGLLANVLAPSSLEYLKVAARAVNNKELNKGTATLLLRGYRALQMRILEMADMLLPNSRSELARVVRDFPVATGKQCVVVPNAMDKSLFAAGSAPLPPDMEKYRDCILCVARIDGLKNQLNLVRAMRNLPYHLVLVGKPAPNHHSYFKRIKEEAGSNVSIIGEIEHVRLPEFYRAARVHALASWMETTGLSSLEAGAMGCNLVITDKGDTRDYFGGFAFYCQPDSVESMRSALVRAYEAPITTSLQKHILGHYTWEAAAQRTLEGYQAVLGYT